MESRKKAKAARVKETAVGEKFLLAIRLSGSFGLDADIEKTLACLKLPARFNAVLLSDNSTMKGMLTKVKDYVTWGELKSEGMIALLRKRGRINGDKKLTDDVPGKMFGEKSLETLSKSLYGGRITLSDIWKKGIKPTFRLHPPSGGFKSSLKRPFGDGGELGYRREEAPKELGLGKSTKEDISELMKRMI